MCAHSQSSISIDLVINIAKEKKQKNTNNIS